MSSEPSSSSQSNFRPSAFLGYNEQHEGEYFYSSDRLSSAGFTNENNTWSQRFSPQYMPLMGVDSGKNTSSGDRAPSTDSLNIRTDEKMPAKGEISEQESNGDGSWSHQVRPFDWLLLMLVVVLKTSLYIDRSIRCRTMTMFRPTWVLMTQRWHARAGVWVTNKICHIEWIIWRTFYPNCKSKYYVYSS